LRLKVFFVRATVGKREMTEKSYVDTHTHTHTHTHTDIRLL